MDPSESFVLFDRNVFEHGNQKDTDGSCHGSFFLAFGHRGLLHGQEAMPGSSRRILSLPLRQGYMMILVFGVREPRGVSWSPWCTIPR